MLARRYTDLLEWRSLPTISMSTLRTLSMRNYGLTSIPAEFANLTNLNVLDLTGNRLTGLSLNGLTSLRGLVLQNCELTALPTDIGRLTNMRLLNLGYNRLVDLPRTMSSMTRLAAVNLNGNPMRVLPAVVCQWTELLVLTTARTEIVDLPSDMIALRDLRTFVVPETINHNSPVLTRVRFRIMLNRCFDKTQPGDETVSMISMYGHAAVAA